MQLLQGGYPKSGNYWLYCIVQQIFKHAGIEQKNFIRQHPIYSLAKSWTLSYPEQVDINMIDILYEGSFFRISSRYREKISDMQAYIAQNTHVWTHSNYCARSEQVFPMFDKCLYIIRDVRDVLLSTAHFAFTPYMQEFYPCWQQNEQQFLDTEIHKLSAHWAQHVKEYFQQAQKHNIYLLYYENLLTDFRHELNKLLAYLNIELEEKQKLQIEEKVSFSHLKEKSPQHVRKPRLYKWQQKLKAEHQTLLHPEALELLKELNYPDSTPDFKGLKSS
jgi:aryl sulfotransferase